jgi:formate-dependent nitrite reductase cytochrome c552 subunit
MASDTDPTRHECLTLLEAPIHHPEEVTGIGCHIPTIQGIHDGI